MTWALAAACLIASIPAGLRWLRIAQREHYLAPSVTRFSLLWWTQGPVNLGLSSVALAGLLGSLWTVWPGFVAAAAQLGPIGLPVKGVSSPLVWTNRLKRLAVVSGLPVFAAYLLGGLTKTPSLVVAGLLVYPALVDGSLWLLRPIEQKLGAKWVEKAARKLNSVGADVVAITGSYGKTTTKGYVAHLLTGSRRVVASPASFNNRMGLARAINEQLIPGTEVFVAEMGTYGPGEIAELCGWVRPKVGAIVSIGPVHLERFKTEERILAAKSEILDKAEVGVLCVDHPLLERLARERADVMEIISVSTHGSGRVNVAAGVASVDGMPLAPVPEGVFPANVAVAIGVGVALGVDVDELVSRLADLPVAEHRQAVYQSERGFSIIDDTFNSNPAGARAGLELLSKMGGKRVVVTPGMIELGPLQDEENAAFAAVASETADHLIVVGHTNRHALITGSAGGRASVTVVASREEAVAWVRGNLGPGDTVLYENDLPDHYP